MPIAFRLAGRGREAGVLVCPHMANALPTVKTESPLRASIFSTRVVILGGAGYRLLARLGSRIVPAEVVQTPQYGGDVSSGWLCVDFISKKRRRASGNMVAVSTIRQPPLQTDRPPCFATLRQMTEYGPFSVERLAFSRSPTSRAYCHKMP
jgi:hypothetical protein